VHEKRRHFRRSLSHPVEFAVDDGPRTAGVCRDLSLGGMAIEAPAPIAFGAKLTVFMRLTGIAGECTLSGVVRWTHGPLLGVQFGLMGARETYALTALIES
jgi:PilZ domain